MSERFALNWKVWPQTGMIPQKTIPVTSQCVAIIYPCSYENDILLCFDRIAYGFVWKYAEHKIMLPPRTLHNPILKFSSHTKLNNCNLTQVGSCRRRPKKPTVSLDHHGAKKCSCHLHTTRIITLSQKTQSWSEGWIFPQLAKRIQRQPRIKSYLYLYLYIYMKLYE